MFTKFCPQCQLSKLLSEFGIRRASADGLARLCKSCQSAYDRTRLDNPKRVLARERVRIERRNDPEKKAADDEGKRNWAKRNPLARQAYNVVNNALRDGKLIKPAFCDSCEQPAEVEAHHKDYNKPLEVDWLCTGCHGYDHRKVA